MMKTTMSKSSFGKLGMILGGVVVLSGAIAQADTFGTGASVFSLDFVPVGNAGNGNDPATGGVYGGVAYDYRMGTYEISQGSINAAVASGLTGITANNWSQVKPSNGITWYQAAGFVNWLNTSTGHQPAYQLNAGLTEMTLWSSAEAWQEGGENLYRNKNAYYFLPSRNEWHKAAYHKNDGVTADYWLYPTASNAIPTQVTSGTSAGTAVYGYSLGQGPASVYTAGGLSAYGTMAQGGNVWEWGESAYDGSNDSATERRAGLGGPWLDPSEFMLSSCMWGNALPTGTFSSVGFRVASVPEPSSAVLMIGAGVLGLARRRARVDFCG